MTQAESVFKARSSSFSMGKMMPLPDASSPTSSKPATLTGSQGRRYSGTLSRSLTCSLPHTESERQSASDLRGLEQKGRMVGSRLEALVARPLIGRRGQATTEKSIGAAGRGMATEADTSSRTRSRGNAPNKTAHRASTGSILPETKSGSGGEVGDKGTTIALSVTCRGGPHLPSISKKVPVPPRPPPLRKSYRASDSTCMIPLDDLKSSKVDGCQ